MVSERKEWKFLGLTVALLFVVGVTLLAFAYYNRDHHLTHDILRDIGIAFLISGLVTIAYEIYARSRFDLAKIETLLDTVYGSGVPVGIWESIKESLLNRKVLRRNSILRVRVRRDPAVGKEFVVLSIDLVYDLVSLVSKPEPLQIVHGLDEHIAAAHLPRFVEASIDDYSETIGGEDPWTSENKKMAVKAGRLTMDIELPSAKENKAIQLHVAREEVRWCPGSYYLIMSEITDGMTVYLDDWAEDVNVKLFSYPASRDIDLTAKHIAPIKDPLLPGHCLEFKLTKKPPSNTSQV